MIFKNEDEKLRKRSGIEETDTFWDVGSIVPPRRPSVTEKRRSSRESVLIYDREHRQARKKPYTIEKPEDVSELVKTYGPSSPLIDRVAVYTWPYRYTFYERFRQDAEKYFDVAPNETQPVKYFSYMPSYIQMSIRQREWYFYWRSKVRQREYLPADSSYILLYVYEILNLPQMIPASEGLELLCAVWENYRKSYTKLDKYMSEWICDYCLINELETPLPRIGGFIEEAVGNSSLPQFYCECSDEDAYAALLFEKLCSYRWNKSKWIDGGNKELFARHVRNGFIYAAKKYASFDGRFDPGSGRMIKKKTVRDSFSGSLCAYEVKRRIEVEYSDLANTGDLGFVVTDMARYCENCVRAGLGIRSRLGVRNLTEQQKKIIDEYFAEKFPPLFDRKTRGRTDDEWREEKEIPRTFSVSYERAKEIENRSWETTDMLVDEGSYEEEPENCAEEENAPQASIESEALETARIALRCIANGDRDGFEKTASGNYMLPETLIECVNELCFEILGDIGVEEKDGFYALIPDYEQEIRQWLNL